MNENGHVLSLADIDELESLQDRCQISDTWGFRGHPSKFSTWKAFQRWIRCYAFWKAKTFNRLGRKPKSESRINERDDFYDTDVEELRLSSHMIRRRAMLMAARMMQIECFPRTRRELELHGFVFRSSDLVAIQPTLAGDGLIRSMGRLSSMPGLTYDQRSPIIAHRKHPMTRLYVEYIHAVKQSHAAGATQLLAAVNRTFWVPQGRALARDVVRHCVECRRRLAKKREQVMADLPEFRLPQNPNEFAFQTCGMDAFGPFHVKVARSTRNVAGVVKRWICIFTCTRYRCVHLEVLHDSSTDAFMSAFSRFLARRPRPEEVITDNGTNFVGCKNILKAIKAEVGELDDRFPEITWRMNPPKHPQSGGFYERLIGSAKRAIYAQLNKDEPTEDEFLTIVTITEGLMNSRPLSYVGTDAGDLLPLTPNHFIMGKELTEICPLPAKGTPVKQWAYIQRTMDKLWTRMIDEVAPTHHPVPRDKRNPYFDDLAVGDVVVVLQNKHRGRWPLGRIRKILRDPHKVPRAVHVDVQGSVLHRPIDAVYPLPRVNEKETEAVAPYAARLKAPFKWKLEHEDKYDDDEVEAETEELDMGENVQYVNFLQVPWVIHESLHVIQSGATPRPKPKSGYEKSGDEKSGDEKSGDEKSGDEKSGDERSGDEKSGDEKPGESKKDD